MTYPMEFTLTADHIKLVRAMYVNWNDRGYDGAPEVNIKRPYGNSDVPGDVAELIGVEQDCEEEGFKPETIDRLMALHKETATALQIILSTGSFETGTYRRPEKYDTKCWVRA